MAEKEDKVILEREYIIPLRRKFINTPKYRRVPRAVKALKSFIARHMKIYDKDLGKIKIDKYLNEELWFRGIQKPPHKIKVKCKKFDSGIVRVELAEMPQVLKWKKEKEDKQLLEKVGKTKKKEEKKAEEKLEEKKEEVKEEKIEKVEEKKEFEEKEKATVEAGLKEQDMKAKEIKHEVKFEKQPKHKFRKALQK